MVVWLQVLRPKEFGPMLATQADDRRANSRRVCALTLGQPPDATPGPGCCQTRLRAHPSLLYGDK